ncbi:hypothetical protein QC762_0025960 [Podospora pseudocomata]|uniref:Uncharacterized protein n=1 Tax=Podospora pseudocomata TaxID=2093779 RepID=A0ABR0GR60_9PEZI|nr:hypothetical protein QC762_0025960 [Podospora pseudocomata]
MRKRSPKRKRKREVPEFAEAPWPTIIGQGLMWVHDARCCDIPRKSIGCRTRQSRYGDRRRLHLAEL